MRIEDKSKYQKKRKSEEKDRVCKKDQEDIEKSQGNIKKSIEGDKIISRYEKEIS